MTTVWDKSDDSIWFGKMLDEANSLQLCLVVEHLPDSRRWAWAVWQSDEPRILRRGISMQATIARVTAEAAAASWRKFGSGGIGATRPAPEARWQPASMLQLT